MSSDRWPVVSWSAGIPARVFRSEAFCNAQNQCGFASTIPQIRLKRQKIHIGADIIRSTFPTSVAIPFLCRRLRRLEKEFGVLPTTGVVGYKSAAIFDGWGLVFNRIVKDDRNLSPTFNQVVEDDEILVAHDASRGTFDEIVIKSSKTTT